MNIYHITYSPEPKMVCLYFWGCNLNCRGCLCHKEIYDCHLEETRWALFDPVKTAAPTPPAFLALAEVEPILSALDVRRVIFMGQEPAIDPELPRLAELLHKKFSSHNILLTNGLRLPDLNDIDEVVFSIKAVSDNLHRHYTGKSNRGTLANFVSLYKSGFKLRAESIFIPEYIDCPEIERIAKFIAELDKSIPYRIDAYIPVGDNPWRRPTIEEMEVAVMVARRHLTEVSCLTGNEELKYEVIRIV
ncbi:MAG: radical SAM protein [Dehalococcoidales bacterium]|nr:radical SAM protein [Dehalococcoidales bacterium]